MLCGRWPTRCCIVRPTFRLNSWSVAAELDVAFQLDRIVALDERIDELVDGDGLLVFEALAEIPPLQHAGDGVRFRQADEAVRAQLFHPLAVVADFCLIPVQDLEGLLGVGLGVALDGGRVDVRPCGIALGRIADQGGEVAD